MKHSIETYVQVLTNIYNNRVNTAKHINKLLHVFKVFLNTLNKCKSYERKYMYWQILVAILDFNYFWRPFFSFKMSNMSISSTFTHH